MTFSDTPCAFKGYLYKKAHVSSEISSAQWHEMHDQLSEMEKVPG